jgi:hypothetical protein
MPSQSKLEIPGNSGVESTGPTSKNVDVKRAHRSSIADTAVRLHIICTQAGAEQRRCRFLDYALRAPLGMTYF